jgi:hypothetical protein
VDGNLARLEITILGGAHLFFGWQIDPQLEAAHQTTLLLRHLRMDDAAPSGHPLHTTGFQVTTIAEVILVQHVTREHVGDGLKTAMRMRRKTRNVFVRSIAAELIKHQKRIEPCKVRLPETAIQRDTSTVGGTQRLDYPLQGFDRTKHQTASLPALAICSRALRSASVL